MAGGNVQAWQREDVRRIVNRDFHSNTYLLRAPEGRACTIVDPGLDREAIEAELVASGWQPQAIVLTHGHFDHLGGAAWLQQAHGLPVVMRKGDLKLAKMANFMMAAFKLPQRIGLPEFQLIEGDAPTFDAAGRHFTFHALPGHTPGSAGIRVDDLFFSGDSLYARKTALSKLPGEDHDQLRASLKGLFAWIPGDTRVLPGHGGSATIDEIRQHNEELRSFMAAGMTA